MTDRASDVPFLRSVYLDGEVPAGYPFDLPAVRSLSELSLDQPLTVFFGENGTGKSTVLEAVAVSAGFNPEGGSAHFRFETRESHSELHRYVRVVRNARREQTGWFLRAESLFNAATYLESLPGPSIRSYGDRPLHEMSHGEAILALVINRFAGNGLYLLDEPEGPLSPLRQLALATRLRDLVDEGSQVVVAAHSPILAAIPGATIYEFGKSGIAVATWDQLDAVKLMRDFLEAPARFFNA